MYESEIVPVPKYHAMKTSGIEAKLHVFLTPTLVADERNFTLWRQYIAW
jgi:hypothetical protein